MPFFASLRVNSELEGLMRRETSLRVYRQIEAEGLLSKRRLLAYQTLSLSPAERAPRIALKPHTDWGSRSFSF